MTTFLSLILICANTVGGAIYLMPNQTATCGGGLREAFATYPDGELKRGCYEIQGQDVVIIDEDRNGYVVPLSSFTDSDGVELARNHEVSRI